MPLEVSLAPYGAPDRIPNFGGPSQMLPGVTLADCSVCEVRLNTSIAGRGGTQTDALWSVRVTNTGAATAPAGQLGVIVEKTAGPGSIDFVSSPVAVPSLGPGQSAVVNVNIRSSGTSAATFVRATFTPGAGCMAPSPQIFSFQRLR
jgi:hypothetical protein